MKRSISFAPAKIASSSDILKTREGENNFKFIFKKACQK